MFCQGNDVGELKRFLELCLDRLGGFQGCYERMSALFVETLVAELTQPDRDTGLVVHDSCSE